jgi:excinuclease ABC subunit B
VVTPLREASQLWTPEQIEKRLVELRLQMQVAAKALEFEKAAQLRDQLRSLEAQRLAM